MDKAKGIRKDAREGRLKRDKGGYTAKKTSARFLNQKISVRHDYAFRLITSTCCRGVDRVKKKRKKKKKEKKREESGDNWKGSRRKEVSFDRSKGEEQDSRNVGNIPRVGKLGDEVYSRTLYTSRIVSTRAIHRSWRMCPAVASIRFRPIEGTAERRGGITRHRSSRRN